MNNKRSWIIDMISQSVNGTKSERVQTAEMIVDQLQEEGLLNLGYGDNDIDRVVEQFQTTFGNTKTTKYDRYAANRLIKRYDIKTVITVIQMLGGSRDDRYAPVVGNISQLETKWVSILNFLRKRDPDETIEVG